jgi:hypothetical protein
LLSAELYCTIAFIEIISATVALPAVSLPGFEGIFHPNRAYYAE